MSLTDILPILAIGVFIAAGILVMIKAGGESSQARKNIWMIPALFSLLLAAWSLISGLKEGPAGFWPEHVRNMWGNQIWFDLLMAGAMAWVLMVPKAKALGMKLPLWFAFIACTGSVGGGAMLARIFYLQENRPNLTMTNM